MRMTQSPPEIADAACSFPGAKSLDEEPPRRLAACTGLFQRQLAASGLERVAEKVAAGCAIEFEDAMLLSRASLPLLGRIVRSAPASVVWTSESVVQLAPDGEANGDSSASLALRASMQIAQPLTDWETFCRALLETRRELAAVSDAVVWFPQVRQQPDTHGVHDGQYTGVDVLRAIALARLVLPARVRIVAPVSTLGPKLAQVALEFGASHVGFAAGSAELEELRAGCSPTPLKEGL